MASFINKDNNNDLEQIIQLLANLSLADSIHDFSKGIKGLEKNLKEDKLKNIYNKGLPIDFEEMLHEDDTLKTVVKLLNNQQNNNYSPIVLFQEKENEYQITTINNLNYDVKTIQVKNKNSTDTNENEHDVLLENEDESAYIDANTLITNFKFTGKNVFVIDAAAVSLTTILSKGPKVDSTTFYYVMAPEIINDPATKTALDDSLFDFYEKKGTGVRIVPCESNVPESINYTYKWDKTSNDSYDKFFTNYNFQLSEMQRQKKGKTIGYTTNLNISYNTTENTYRSEPIIDTKYENSINRLISFIVTLFDKISKKPDPKISFDYNCKFQQKRSGDWLQVLLCKNIRERQFKQFNKNGPSQKTEIQNEFENVYLVTHDRIALAFALLMGVECIFTHGATGTITLYKNSNQEDITNRKIENAKRIITEQNKFEESKNLTLNRMTDYIESLYNPYVEIHKDSIKTNINKLEQFLNTEQNIDNISKGLPVSIKEIFTASIMYSYFKQNLPNMDDSLKYFNNLNMNQMFVGLNPDTEYNEIIKRNDDFETHSRSCNRTLDTYFEELDNNKRNIKINIGLMIKSIQKQPAYLYAKEWKWDISISSRVWQVMSSYSGLKNDIHIFLANIQGLDDELRVSLLSVFIRLYKIINATKIDTKFTKVTIAFCIELFIQLGGTMKGKPIIENNIENEIQFLINDFISNKSNTNDILNQGKIVEETTQCIIDEKENRITSSSEIDEKTEIEINNQQGGEVKNSQDLLPEKTGIPSFKYIINQNVKQVTYPLLSMFLLRDDYINNILFQDVYQIENTSPMEIDTAQDNVIDIKRKRDDENDVPENVFKLPKYNGGNDKEFMFEKSNWFHPKLPLYMITVAFYNMIHENAIEESLDYSLYIRYLKFLKRIDYELSKEYINYDEISKTTALYIGMGLKTFLFTANSNIDLVEKCAKLFNMTISQYMRISLLNGQLSNSICGIINQTDADNKLDNIILDSDLFKNFISNVMNNKLFIKLDENVYEDTFNLLTRISGNIVEETSQIINEQKKDIIVRKEKAYISNIRSSLAKQNIKETGIHTLADYPRNKTTENDTQNMVTSSTNAVPKRRGGRKTRKNRKSKSKTRKHKNKTK
jgi:hypothetical protein